MSNIPVMLCLSQPAKTRSSAVQQQRPSRGNESQANANFAHQTLHAESEPGTVRQTIKTVLLSIDLRQQGNAYTVSESCKCRNIVDRFLSCF